MFFNFFEQDAVHAYSGGLDNTLKMYDINSNTGIKTILLIVGILHRRFASFIFISHIFLYTESVMGTHDKPIRKIEYCAAVNAILTGGWDAAVKLWDPRTPTCVGSYQQPETVLALSVCGDKFVVGTAKRKVCIWDLRNMAGMFQRRESSLKYQTRCIKGFPNEQVGGENFGIDGSIIFDCAKKNSRALYFLISGLRS